LSVLVRPKSGQGGQATTSAGWSSDCQEVVDSGAYGSEGGVLSHTICLVKARRLQTAQRANRRVQRFVINVPSPTVVVAPAPAAPKPPSPSFTARLWYIAKTLGPAIVAVAALVISLAALLNQRTANNVQREADQAAAAANQRQWAERVSFIESSKQAGPYVTVEVQNSSTSPVTNVALTVDAFAAAGPAGRNAFFHVTLLIGNIPACSTGLPDVTAKLLAIAGKELGVKLKPNRIGYQISAMYFTDRNGVIWDDQSSGLLGRITPIEMFNQTDQSGPDDVLTPNYKTASGCS
jgi:hypothetical protein